MIDRHQKYFQRVLRLAAFIAARQSVMPCVGARSRGPTWPPLVLHWRRRRRLSPAVGTAKNQRPRVLYFPQFHFHFSSQVTGHGDQERRRGDAVFVTARDRRMVVDHRWFRSTVKPSGSPGAQTNRATGNVLREISRVPANVSPMTPFYPSPSTRTRPTRTERVPETHAPRVTQPGRYRRRSLSRTAVPSPSTRPSSIPQRTSEKLPPGRSSGQRPEHRSYFLRKYSEIRRRTDRVTAIGEIRPADIGRDRSLIQRPSRQVAYSEELVWRRTRNRAAADEPDGHGSAETPVRTKPRMVAVDEITSEAPSPVEAAAPLTVNKIDPALLDRLTEFVISRVEKRISIERERRGM